MSISRIEAVFAATQCMTNQDAIDFIDENVTTEDLAALFDDKPNPEVKLWPGVAYGSKMLRTKSKPNDEEEES